MYIFYYKLVVYSIVSLVAYIVIIAFCLESVNMAAEIFHLVFFCIAKLKSASLMSLNIYMVTVDFKENQF